MKKPRKQREKRTPNPAFAGLPRLAFSISEAAHMLAVSESTVRQWAHAGRLRVLWKGAGGDRKHFSVPRQSIEDLLSKL